MYFKLSVLRLTEKTTSIHQLPALQGALKTSCAWYGILTEGKGAAAAHQVSSHTCACKFIYIKGGNDEQNQAQTAMDSLKINAKVDINPGRAGEGLGIRA